MKRLSLIADEDAAEAGRTTADVVRSGGVVLLPTETFYGLAADPASADAVARIYAMKARPERHPLPVLCSDWAQLESLAEVPDRHRVRLSRIWPGPLTAILRCRADLPVVLEGTIAVRIPGHAMLRTVLYRSGCVTGTSANRHREPPPCDVDSALASLESAPDLVLDGGATPGGEPSTIVDLTSDEPRVLRRGAFLWDEVFPWDSELPRH
jgi:L-threonylcarbamoyladenylate synthase